MARVGDVIVVYMLEPQAVGSYFDRHRWPLHLTLLPWFGAAPDKRGPLLRELLLLAREIPPVQITVGEQHLFGPKKDIPVNIIADRERLQPLHDSLLHLTRLLQLPLADAKWTGPQYTAHVSRYEDRAANEGDHLLVDNFYLVELFDGRTCQIIERFKLAGTAA